MLSGCHIGFGAFLLLSVGGACPGLAATNPGLKSIIMGAFGLPFGLFMTIMSGAELFTGNTALVTMAKLEGKVTGEQVRASLRPTTRAPTRPHIWRVSLTLRARAATLGGGATAQRDINVAQPFLQQCRVRRRPGTR